MPKKNIVKRLVNFTAKRLRDPALIGDMLLLQGQIAARQVRAIDRPIALSEVEFRVFSQWGEDGILEWLVSRLPDIPQSFIEFGVENFFQANCRFLMQHRNWQGLVIDSSPNNINQLISSEMYWSNDLTAIESFITTDNINSIFSSSGFTGSLGVLSVDIDGNDYWVWQAISCIDPWIVICEYNSAFGDIHPLTIPYDSGFIRNQKHSSNLYYGCSIRATEHVAISKGYVLLGTNRAGSNAFFIRKDLEPRFEAALEDRRPRPSMFRESRSPNGALSYLSGRARSQAISALPVVDVSSGKTANLSQFEPLYSEDWLGRMGG